MDLLRGNAASGRINLAAVVERAQFANLEPNYLSTNVILVLHAIPYTFDLVTELVVDDIHPSEQVEDIVIFDQRFFWSAVVILCHMEVLTLG